MKGFDDLGVSLIFSMLGPKLYDYNLVVIKSDFAFFSPVIFWFEFSLGIEKSDLFYYEPEAVHSCISLQNIRKVIQPKLLAVSANVMGHILSLCHFISGNNSKLLCLWHWHYFLVEYFNDVTL